MTSRQRQRRTLGSGPPPDLLFGELAYSDGDGLIHVGRPDGTARSFAPGEAGPHTHDYAALIHGHPWSQITGTPATYPPSSHEHSYASAESGFWTPSIFGAATPGTANYIRRDGRYTKVADLVTVSFFIAGNFVVPPTGQALIGGLPFIGSASVPAVQAAIGYANPEVYLYISPGHNYLSLARNAGFHAPLSTCDFGVHINGNLFQIHAALTFAT